MNDALLALIKEFGLLALAIVVFAVTLKNKVAEIGKKLIESDESVDSGFKEVNRGIKTLSQTVTSMKVDLAAHDVRTQDLRQRVIRLEDHLIEDK